MDSNRRGSAPLLEDISGSKNWDNAVDQGFVIHRDEVFTNGIRQTGATLYCRKSRFEELGFPCAFELDFDLRTGAYRSTDYDPKPMPAAPRKRMARGDSMTIHLDPRFAKVFALMESTTHAGERANARKSAEAIANSCGLTFEQAKAQMNKPPQTPNIFEGFDDWMERQEPGWKAKRTAEHAERRARNALKRAAVIAKYGTPEAALAPCDRENLILAAVKRWAETARGTSRPMDR